MRRCKVYFNCAYKEICYHARLHNPEVEMVFGRISGDHTMLTKARTEGNSCFNECGNFHVPDSICEEIDD
jgi:hypothetical protein